MSGQTRLTYMALAFSRRGRIVCWVGLLVGLVVTFGSGLLHAPAPVTFIAGFAGALIGMPLLRHHRDHPQNVAELEAQWKYARDPAPRDVVDRKPR